MDLKQPLQFDSMATISQHAKLGLGRMKHVALRFLVVKDFLGSVGGCRSGQVLGTKNPVDIGTEGAGCQHTSIRSIINLDLVKQEVEEIKGNKQNWQWFCEVWDCTNVGKAWVFVGSQWTQENSMLVERCFPSVLSC